VTSIMPQLISAVRKFAKIDAGDFFGTIHGSRNRLVDSPGASAGIRSGAGGPHDASLRRFGPRTGIFTHPRWRGNGPGKRAFNGAGLPSNTSQRGSRRPRPHHAI
jgi:hypothetical protein